MRPITVNELAISHASKISLQRRLAIRLERQGDRLSVATGIVAVTVLTINFVAAVVLIVRGL